MRLEHRWSLILFFALIVASAVVILVAPAASQGPLDDLTHEPCLGEDDVFCQPDEDNGGGSGNSFCYTCSFMEGDTHFECRAGSNSDECSIVYDSQGRRSCNYTGNEC